MWGYWRSAIVEGILTPGPKATDYVLDGDVTRLFHSRVAADAV
jgi:hypothetical protein